MTPSVSVKARFWGFAGAHIVVSLLGAGVLFLFLMLQFSVRGAMTSNVPYFLLCAFLMLLYVPAGFLVARRRGWTRPGGREGLLAVLLPALAAWAWEGIGLGLSILSQHTVLAGLIVVGLAALLASPSFFFMFLCCIHLSYQMDNLQLVFCMFLAGLLPPLLFLLGTLAGGRTQRAPAAEAS